LTSDSIGSVLIPIKTLQKS